MGIVKDFSFFEQSFTYYLQQQRLDWKNNNQFDGAILVSGVVCFFVALISFFIGGHHIGFVFFHRLGHQIAPDFFWANLTFLGDTLVAMSVILFFCYRKPQIALATLLGAIITTLCIHGFKHGINLVRPPAILDASSIQVIGPIYKKLSFPSGHTATAFLMASLLTRCVCHAWQKKLLLLLAISVGLSRVVCGVHWPIDTLVGAGIGLFSGWLALSLSDRWCIGIRLYCFVVILLVTAAFLLSAHDGGMDQVYLTSQFFSIGSLFFFLICLLSHIFTLISESNAHRTSAE